MDDVFYKLVLNKLYKVKNLWEEKKVYSNENLLNCT